jgi:serine/threonine protein kinase
VPLTANERILVLSDVSQGLAYLHSEQRLIHRDVKSANVLLDEGCRGRIGDFGIARSLNDNSAGITVSQIQTEHVMGTQVYMALHQAPDAVTCSQCLRRNSTLPASF